MEARIRRTTGVRHAGCQVLLCQLEFRQKSVFEDIYFVRIQLHPLVNAAVSLVSDFDDVALADFTLNAQVPGLHVGLVNVGIDAVHSRPVTEEGFIGLRNDILVGGRA